MRSSKCHSGRNYQIYKWKSTKIIQPLLLEHMQKKVRHGTLLKVLKQAPDLKYNRCSFYAWQTSTLLWTQDPTNLEKYSNAAEQHQWYDWKKTCFEKRLPIKYRKEKSVEVAHRIQLQKCKNTLQMEQASYKPQKFMLKKKMSKY